MKFSCFVFCLLFTVYLLFVSFAYCHKVNIYAYAKDGMIHSESYFSDGAKCKNAVVEVFDEKEKTKLIEGKTDEQGKFSFKIPRITSLKLVVHAGMGHLAKFTISEDEIKEAMGIRQYPKLPSVKVSLKSEESTLMKSAKETREISEFKGISKSQIEEIVKNVVAKELEPLMRMLVKLQETIMKPSITEIIGAIGYIIGILGIIAYFKAKKGKK